MNNIIKIIKEQIVNISLIFRLSVYDIKGQYSQHYLGMFWQFLNPLIQISIYWLVFGLGIRGGKPVDHIPFFFWLISGLIPWFFINKTITQGSNSIFSRLNLVSKMKFPVSILPSITIISNSFSFIVMSIVLIVILVLGGMELNIYMLQLPYYLFSIGFFLFSITIFCSTFSTIVRDFQSLIQTIMKLLFYLTPILWDIDKLPMLIKKLLMLNPIYYLINGFRETFLYKTWFFEDMAYTVYFWVITLFILFLGAGIHMKFRKKFFDYL